MTTDRASIAQMPSVPASAIDEHGWTGVKQSLASTGRLAITSHGEFEAVILSVTDYAKLADDALRYANPADIQPETGAADPLQALREHFKLRLASLNEPGAADRLRVLMGEPSGLNRQVIAGKTY